MSAPPRSGPARRPAAPPTSQEVRLARRNERAPSEKAAKGYVHQRQPWVLPAYAGFIVLAAVALGVGLWLTH
ncbi:hypothetical protein [Methylobacterium tardum]|uniref:hypothetical protein n=1 Tax=Methylobacterium tardum TaxID=374432 RepID=UPI00360FDED4